MPSCIICGKECARVTCSEECRLRRANDRHNERKRIRRAEAAAKRPKKICTCTICGEAFEYTSGKVRKTCGSPDCQLAYRRQFDIDRYGRVAREFDCPVCGKHISTFRRSQLTCGSDACYNRHYGIINGDDMRIKKQMRSGGITPPDAMPCPWATGKADTLPPGVKTWDCPEMDPFGAGHYHIRLDMGEAVERRNAA